MPRMMPGSAILAFIAGLLALMTAPVAAMDGLTTSDVQIRATAPGMTATGGYLTIHNHTGQADRLLGVAVDFAAKAEIHTMLHENGVMKMRALPDGIEIPAGGMVRLAPGGMHLMLMGLSRTLEPGVRLEVELTFASGRVMRLPADVKRPGEISFDEVDMSAGNTHSQNHLQNNSQGHSGN